jgi:uncharacterized protein (DUF433 family)
VKSIFGLLHGERDGFIFRQHVIEIEVRRAIIRHKEQIPAITIRGKEIKFGRITTDPEICGGKPCIRGIRFPVSRLLGLLAAGEAKDSILREYPYLEAGDSDEALHYAACLADGEIIEFAS